MVSEAVEGNDSFVTERNTGLNDVQGAFLRKVDRVISRGGFVLIQNAQFLVQTSRQLRTEICFFLFLLVGPLQLGLEHEQLV